MMLDWPSLRDGKCPIDQGPLHFHFFDGFYTCENKGCDFKIGEEKFDQLLKAIVSPVKKRRAVATEDNAAELNNLGHEIPSEDYSDVEVKA